MKTTIIRIIGIILISFCITNMYAVVPIYLNQTSGECTCDYQNNMDVTWIINTTVNNKPVSIECNTDFADSYDYAKVYSLDAAGNVVGGPLITMYGMDNLTFSTVLPTGKAMVVFHSDSEMCNDALNNCAGLELYFEVDNTPGNSYTPGNSCILGNSCTSGNAIFTGNVGIGVVNPISKLEISQKEPWYGSNYALSVSGYSDLNGLRVNGTVGARSIYSLYQIDVATGNTSPITFTQNVTTERMRIASNGFLGIGTTTPTQKLSVNDGRIAIKTPGATVSDEGYNGAIMITKPAASGQYINLVRQGMMPWSIGTVYNSNTFAIDFGKASDAAFTAPFFNIDNTGKVGIGTTMPNARVESVSNVNAYPVTSGTTQTGSALRLRGGDNAVLDFGMNSINTWIQATDQTNLAQNYNISLNPNGGNVGIGTPSPGAKLDVAGEIKMQGRMGMYINDPSQCFTYDTDKTMGHYSIGWISDSKTSTSGPALWMSGYGGIKLFTTGGQRLTISSQGKVGIGLTKPDEFMATTPVDELLTVNGTIHAKEVKIDLSTNLADYVFHPTYNLMSLPEVEQYVKTNSHLPEIPSAAEVSKNGMSIGEMQNKLLQKVEELTLYVIELQKTNNQQSAKIEELEKKIK